MKENLFDEIDDMNIERISEEYDVLSNKEKDRMFALIEKKYNSGADINFADGNTVSGVEVYSRPKWTKFAAIAASVVLVCGAGFAGVKLFSNINRKVPPKDPLSQPETTAPCCTETTASTTTTEILTTTTTTVTTEISTATAFVSTTTPLPVVTAVENYQEIYDTAASLTQSWLEVANMEHTLLCSDVETDFDIYLNGNPFCTIYFYEVTDSRYPTLQSWLDFKSSFIDDNIIRNNDTNRYYYRLEEGQTEVVSPTHINITDENCPYLQSTLFLECNGKYYRNCTMGRCSYLGPDPILSFDEHQFEIQKKSDDNYLVLRSGVAAADDGSKTDEAFYLFEIAEINGNWKIKNYYSFDEDINGNFHDYSDYGITFDTEQHKISIKNSYPIIAPMQ
ncbi:MAG: hypothetical protein MJ100_07810 [Ruminococcus sp.]|nr:hypothetical protein [Ruminococcus sp.]